jgi:hypothetical protein
MCRCRAAPRACTKRGLPNNPGQVLWGQLRLSMPDPMRPRSGELPLFWTRTERQAEHASIRRISPKNQ